MQFEALMKEVCVDFGRRLIRGWDEGAPKEEVREFVMESVEAFFKRSDGILEKSASTGIMTKSSGLEMMVEIEKVPAKKKKAEPDEEEISDNEAEITVESPKKKKTPAKKKAPVKKSKKEETSEVEETPKKKKAPAKKKATDTNKPKCEGVTAKGTRCSKCAIDGEVFCSIHLKKKEEPKEAKEKKGRATKSKKKEELKHDHEVGEKPEEECELCETHGEAFEMPEYEMVVENNEEEEKKEDPDWALEEEDFEDFE